MEGTTAEARGYNRRPVREGGRRRRIEGRTEGGGVIALERGRERNRGFRRGQVTGRAAVLGR